MLKFKTLRDGNCLYNVFVVAMMASYQQGKLEESLGIFEFRQNLGKLIKIIIQQEAEHHRDLSNNLVKALGSRITKNSVKKSLNVLLDHFKLKPQEPIQEALSTSLQVSVLPQIDWIAVQQLMSRACRTLFIDYIDSIRVPLKKLTSTQKNVRREFNKEIITRLSRSLNSVIKNGTGISSAFEGMDKIINQVKMIGSDEKLSDLTEKMDALKKWFFEGNAEGLKDFLYGINGISKSGVDAGELELKVLTYLFSQKINYYFNVDEKRHCKSIVGFSTPEIAAQENAFLILDIELIDGYWNLLLPENPYHSELIMYYQKQIDQNLSAKRQAKALKKEVLREYGSYQRHHLAESKQCTVEEYCLSMNIPSEKYYQQVKSLKLSTVDQQRPEQEKSEQEKPEQEKPYQKELIKESAVIKQNNVVPKKNNLQSFDLIEYASMFITITSLTAIITYFALTPLLVPYFTYLYAQTVLATYINFMVTTSISLVSLIVGLVATEKYQDKMNNGVLQQVKPIIENKPSQESDISLTIKNILHYYDKQKLKSFLPDDNKLTAMGDRVKNRATID